jgi:hypothetical protein
MKITIPRFLLGLLTVRNVASRPTLTIVNSTFSSLSNGDDFIMYTNATSGYTKSMVYKGNELINTAVGGYSGKIYLSII